MKRILELLNLADGLEMQHHCKLVLKLLKENLIITLPSFQQVEAEEIPKMIENIKG